MAKIKGGTDYINLGSGHSRIMGHKPNKVQLQQIHNAIAKEEGAQRIGEMGLGFWDSSSPNYTTYYPEATPEDFTPAEEDFIEPVFRALSAVTVHKNWNPVYFPEEVLKESMPLLVGQTINIDHETALGNAIGSVKSVEWQDKYKTKGKEIPGGINFVAMIDAKSNPRIARGIQMDPPSIHSNSVTVQFTWEPSHPQMESDDFWRKLGTYDEDGKLIQRVAKKVVGYKETSLVNHGADPFAKQIKDGKIVHPTMAQRQYYGITSNSALSDYSEEKKKRAFSDAFIEFKSFSETSLTADHTIPEELTNNKSTQENSQNMKEYLAQLTVMLIAAGVTEANVTEENFAEKFKELNTAITGLKAKADAGTKDPEKVEFSFGGENFSEKETIQNKINALELKAGVADKALTTLRENTLASYKIVVGDKEDANMVKLIETADYDIALALGEQYGAQAEEKFELTCTKCGSHDVTRASASPKGGKENDEEDDDLENTEIVEDDKAAETIRNKARNKNRPSFARDQKEEE